MEEMLDVVLNGGEVAKEVGRREEKWLMDGLIFWWGVY